MRVFVGHDWAEAHHDVLVEDGDGRRLGGGRLPDGLEGISRFHELVAPHIGDPSEVVVATETDRGLFVGALVAAGYTVLAVNPMSTSRYRERRPRAKSDPGDARVLAELARTDSHNHRPVAGDTEMAEAVKVLARAHQSLIWTRQRQLNQLRSTLREFYPARSKRSLSWATAMPWPCSPSRRPRRWDGRRPGRRSRLRCARRQATAHRRTSRADPNGAAHRPAHRTGSGERSHGLNGHRPRVDRGELTAQIARIEAEMAESLISTRTPRSSVPCQDWG